MKRNDYEEEQKTLWENDQSELTMPGKAGMKICSRCLKTFFCKNSIEYGQIFWNDRFYCPSCAEITGVKVVHPSPDISPDMI